MLLCCGSMRNIRATNATTSSRITLDDIFFRLYYRVTGVMLLIGGSLILLREWSIDAIDCVAPGSVIVRETSTIIGGGKTSGEISHYRVNAYCKMHDDLLIPILPKCQSKNDQNFNGTNRNRNSSNDQNIARSQPLLIASYRWLSAALYFAAILLQIPHLVWRCTSETIFRVALRFQPAKQKSKPESKPEIRAMINDEIGEEEQDRIYAALERTSERNRVTFATLYIALKVANVIALFAIALMLDRILLANRFFDTMFRFPAKIFSIWRPKSSAENDEPNENGYMDIFARSTLCPYRYLDASSGSFRIESVHCLMPINSMLEIIFRFFAAWFLAMFAVSAIDAQRYLTFALVRSLRRHSLRYRTGDIFTERTYRRAARTFASWLYVSLVLLDNVDNHNKNNNNNNNQQKQYYHLDDRNYQCGSMQDRNNRNTTTQEEEDHHLRETRGKIEIENNTV